MDSLRRAPLLGGDLPEAAILDRSGLGKPAPGFELNFNQKLGHLYEDALQHLLEQSQRFSLLAAHLQIVNDEGITLGEMDYLLREGETQMNLQLELAVKFYLAHRSENGWTYPGPDPRDHWQSKLKRMRTHQLRLALLPDSVRLLQERFEMTQLAVRQLIYGRLFIPITEDDCPLPEAMAGDGLRGRWLYCHQFNDWRLASQELRVVPKPLWPVLLTRELVRELPVVGAAELIELAQVRCTLLVVGDSLEPVFLVPDHWPTASAV